MNDFKSKKDRELLVQILKAINPLTVTVYGPALDNWLAGSSDKNTLVAILKTINPSTALFTARLWIPGAGYLSAAKFWSRH